MLNVIFIVGVIALRHLPTLLNVDVDEQGCHFVSFVMHIYDAKFQEHCFNISRDVVYSVFSTFLLQTV